MTNKVINITPVFDSIEKSNATFQTNTFAYNDGTIAYNSSLPYGGRDTVQSVAYIFGVAETIPHLLFVEEATTFSLPGTVTLQAGQSMGLLLAITYPTTTSYVK